MEPSLSSGPTVIRDMLVAGDEEGRLIVSKLVGVNCQCRGTVVVVPVLIAMYPGAERLEEAAV